jgi:hypothetical protein
MSLELAPETESRVREYAEAEGVSIDDLLTRYFPPRVAPRDPRAHVQALLTNWQREYGLPVPPGGYKTTSELFAQWDAEDAQMTEAERETERRFWEDYERGRDDRPLQF